jgi:hypothetical protein
VCNNITYKYFLGLSFTKGKTYWIPRMIEPPCNYKWCPWRDSDGLKNRQTDWKMEKKLAEFLTNSWRQQQNGSRSLVYTIHLCYTTRIPTNVCGNNFLQSLSCNRVTSHDQTKLGAFNTCLHMEVFWYRKVNKFCNQCLNQYNMSVQSVSDPV